MEQWMERLRSFLERRGSSGYVWRELRRLAKLGELGRRDEGGIDAVCAREHGGVGLVVLLDLEGTHVRLLFHHVRLRITTIQIGNSTRGIVESPLWSYQLGLQGGWIPKDPRTAAGTCAALGVPMTPPPTPYPAYMTGGAGAGAPQGVSQLTWPPATIQNAGPASQLPMYADTGRVETLAPPSATAPSTKKEVDFGDGWFSKDDSALAPAEVQGCTYPNAWDNTQNAAFVNSPACRP